MSNSTVGFDLDTGAIQQWRSIVTLVVFILANLAVLFPFYIPIPIPTVVLRWLAVTSKRLRIIPLSSDFGRDPTAGPISRLWFPMNFMTAPLIADLFLLAIQAIGRQEISDGTVGSNNINPIDIMAFFLTLAYIAISIDASGLIRFLAFKVLQWGGKVGHRLFFFLYAFFFALGSFIGNDPIILSGTAFLAYMTRVSDNIEHPRAWIHTQFAVANIASAILVSSNPTNLVLAGAFNIRFIDYTANMVVPVVITAIVMFPFLLYIIFAHERLIPLQVTMHELPDELRKKKPINPNIPNARGDAGEWKDDDKNEERDKLLSLEEIMNPFLDKGGAIFGAAIMAVTLITVLALNAASQDTGEHPVFWVTLPAAVVMFCWDLSFGWLRRNETRRIAREGRREIEDARLRRVTEVSSTESVRDDRSEPGVNELPSENKNGQNHVENIPLAENQSGDIVGDKLRARQAGSHPEDSPKQHRAPEKHGIHFGRDIEPALDGGVPFHSKEPWSLVSLTEDAYRWCQETFPTVTAVLAHLPFALVPFALCMFVLVEALVSKGWVPVFSYGWDHWVNKTGTIGAIGGMGFLSVILCNFAGTNIGTTILLSRVIQGWRQIHINDNGPSDRDFWATVYAMALGVNYGAFSTAFSASLAGLLWRDILARKHIHIRRAEFARVNLPIIAVAMVVGCTVLIGEVYIVRDGTRKFTMNASV